MEETNPGATRNERSDAKFIEWSEGTNLSSFDVVAIAARIASMPAGPVRVLDVGGGIGAFAVALVDSCPSRDVDVVVVDPSASAVPRRRTHDRVSYVTGTLDAGAPPGPFDVIVLRTVVHHFVERTLAGTDRAQRATLGRMRALLAPGGCVCVVENLYEPLVGTDATGRLIFRVTANRVVAFAARRLGANTAGEGVRFRSDASWRALYADAGFVVADESTRPRWGSRMPWWQKWPLLCRGRRQVLHVLVDSAD